MSEIRQRGVTLEQIRAACGFASRGHVHDLATGKQNDISYEIGHKLVKMHAKVRRRKAQ